MRAAPSAAEAQQLEYVRTYARVAHSQLRAVLGALNDELDKLADLAQAGDVAPGVAAAAEHGRPDEAVAAAPDEPGDGGSADEDGGPDGHDASTRATTTSTRDTTTTSTPHDGHHHG